MTLGNCSASPCIKYLIKYVNFVELILSLGSMEEWTRYVGTKSPSQCVCVAHHHVPAYGGDRRGEQKNQDQQQQQHHQLRLKCNRNNYNRALRMDPFFFIDNVGVNEFIGRCHWDYFLVPHGIFLWLHKKPHFAPYHHTAHLHTSSYSVFYFFFFFLAYFLPKFTITKTRMFVTEFD